MLEHMHAQAREELDAPENFSIYQNGKLETAP
jgi:hypothetical protein